MTESSGRCGLCKEPSSLQRSHLLPAAAFRLAREADVANPNPIVVTPRGASSTSKQVSTTFLCAECEDRFSRGGERYVLSQCLRGDDQFAIRDRLRAITPLVEEDGVGVYDVSTVQGIRPEQYLYFAASVFWRASANQWFHDGRPIERITLGGAYQEEFRTYLLAQTPFPANARIFVHVWRGSRPGFTSVMPCSYRVKGTLRHKFCIPGILFILFLGQRTRMDHDKFALNSDQGQFMWVCPFENDSLFQGFGRLIQRAKRSRRQTHRVCNREHR